MIYLRFFARSKVRFGIMKDGKIIELSKSCFENYALTKNKFLLNSVEVLPPCEPSKIIGVGLNYKDHAKELNFPLPKNPILFQKPISAVIAHKAKIVLSRKSKQIDYEGEFAIVIGKKCKNVSVKNSHKYIFGYTCANDVTARDLQKLDGQWARAKAFDTFAPIGPYIVSGINPLKLKIETTLNGKVVQSSNTKNMVFNVYKLVSFISAIMTLLPGDIILTGTPFGVGQLKHNDVLSVNIEKVGQLINTCKKDNGYEN